MPIKLNTKLDKFLASWLVLILVHLYVVVSKNVDFNQTSPSIDRNRTIQIVQNRKHDNPTTGSNSTYQRAKLYPNHRMENDPEFQSSFSPNKNATFNQHDRITSDSILRPQLALQIYTNAPSSPAQDDLPASSSGSNQVFRSAGSTIIMPIRNEEHQAAEQQNTYFETPSYRSPPYQKDLSSRLNPWHYITEKGSNNLLDSYSSNPGSTANDGSAVDQNSIARPAGNSQKPLINAIITVPAASNTDHHHSMSNHIDEASQNSTYTISRLLDDQSPDGIELSLNLNGDEIIINPVGKRNSASAKQGSDNGELSDRQSNAENLLQSDSMNKRARDSHEAKSMSKALGKHVSSEMTVDEQSASEIDMVDNNSGGGGGNNNDADSGDPDAEFIDARPPARERDEETAKARKTADGDQDSNELRRDWRYSSRNDDDQAKDGDNQELSRHPARAHRSSRGKEGHEDRRVAAMRQVNRGPIKSPSSRNSYPKSVRKVSSSKRRSTYKPDEDQLNTLQDGNQPYNSRQAELPIRANESSATPVMISGDDVRRFEQLLENLRSMLSNNPNPGKQKRLSPGKTSMRGAQVQKFSDHNQESNSDESSKNDDDLPLVQEGSGYDKQSNLQRAQSPSIRRLTQSDMSTNNDCDQRKQRQLQDQQRLDRSASGGQPSIESGSSPNIVDQDPIMSSDGQDDLNDESSENSEQEEQGSVNHSKMSLPNPDDSRSSENDADNAKENASSPLMVTKTVLHSYYDNDKPSGQQQDEADLETEHRLQHEAQHEQHINENEYQNDQQRSDRGSDQQAAEKHQAVEDMAPVNNYIDYNQLDDREVYRAGRYPPADSRVARLPREPLDRLGFLQNVMERAAIEEEMRKSSMSRK